MFDYFIFVDHGGSGARSCLLFKTCANSWMVVFLPAEARVLGTPLAAHETKLHAQGKNSLEEAVDLANPVARAR